MRQELGHQFCWITNLEIHDANTAKTLAKKARVSLKTISERLKQLLIFNELDHRIIGRLVGIRVLPGYNETFVREFLSLKFRINRYKTHY